MKGILLTVLILFIATFILTAQSLEDNPDYIMALELQQQSRQAYDAGDFLSAQKLAVESKEYAEKAEIWLQNELAKPILPAFYVVRYIEGNTDALWKISNYEFVYSDPYKWNLLYETNKNDFPQRDNPHLIYPGMILSIPVLDGEMRSGTWENGTIR